MKKKIFVFTAFVFLLTACAARSPQMEAMAPVKMGGDASYDRAMEAEESFSSDVGSSLPEGESIERMVIKNADLSIAVESPSHTMDAIMEMAENMGGYVTSSNLYETQTESGIKVHRARITIRVPSQVLDKALEEIKSGAGQVLSENISGEDVTREYTDLGSRLRNLENTETQLAKIMEETKDTEDVLAIYNRLIEIREEIEIIIGQMQYYEQSAALSSISVDIQANEAVQPLTIGGWQPVGVAKKAIQALINILEGIGNLLIWLVLLGVPLVFILYLLSFPSRWSWKGIKRLFGFRKSKKAKKNKEQPSEE